MKVGVVYPQIELKGDPGCVDEIGKATEQLGFDHFLMYDHVVGAARVERDPPLWEGGPYTDKDPFHDPFVAFAYLAGRYETINFVSGVLVLPARQTVLVAKQAADLDLLSGGRLTLGVGIGWNFVEYDALGMDFKTRGKRMTEQIDYLRRLWTEPLLTYKGDFEFIDRAALIPRPNRKIPLVLGGVSEPAFKRAAKMGDGFIFAADFDDACMPQWQRVQELLKEEGRDTKDFLAYHIVQNNDVSGKSPQEAVDVVKRWQDAGGTHASICTMGLGYKTSVQHVDYLAEVKSLLG